MKYWKETMVVWHASEEEPEPHAITYDDTVICDSVHNVEHIENPWADDDWNPSLLVNGKDLPERPKLELDDALVDRWLELHARLMEIGYGYTVHARLTGCNDVIDYIDIGSTTWAERHPSFTAIEEDLEQWCLDATRDNLVFDVFGEYGGEVVFKFCVGDARVVVETSNEFLQTVSADSLEVEIDR